MARTVNRQSQIVKRTEILNAALQLVSTKGYESMAIQDLLGNLGISKGALYHYFPSKVALLEALVDRMCLEAAQVLASIADDRSSPAAESFSRFFVSLARYKADQRAFIVAVLPVWYSDVNAVLRDKVRLGLVSRLSPMIATIIRRGCDEGSFSVSDPEQSARLVLGLTQDLAEALARQLLSGGGGPSISHQMKQMVTSTTEGVERVLAASTGSLRLVESGGLDVWVRPSEGESG